jgi:hypothetical protein
MAPRAQKQRITVFIEAFYTQNSRKLNAIRFPMVPVPFDIFICHPPKMDERGIEIRSQFGQFILL